MVESNASERRAEAPRRIATLFRNLVDLCPDAMGVVAEGEIVLLNAAGARLFGAPSSDDLIGRRIIDFVHPDSRDYFLAQVSVLTGPGRETRFEHRAVRLDGSEVDLEVAASAADLDGRPAVQFVARDVTERKRTEERLRLFVAAVDAAPDGVQLVDLEGRVLYSNRAVEDIYGYSPEELRGRHVNEMNADPTFAEQVILPTLRREGRWDGELAVKHKDGHVFPVWLTASIAGGGAGEAPLALVGIIRDVTERKRLEEALRASEERFRLIAENAHDLVSRFRLTPPRGYEYVSPAAFRITGYAPEEFYADPDLGVKIVHPDDRGLLEAALLRPEEFDQPILQRWTRKDGTVIWSEQRVAPVYDDSGQLVAVESIARDISDRKRAEEQAQAERDRFEAMVETSPVGVLVAEARSGRIAFVNQEAQRILGVVRRDADRLDRLAEAATYLRPDGAPYDVMDLPLQRALYRGESTRAEEILLELPDGRTVPTLVNATPIYGADGEIESAIAIIQDISPIEELERLRNDFLAMVSHELRTPLTAIKGAAATALESGVDLRSDEAQDLFRIVDDQVSRLRDLVSNLMDITRIEAGALSISCEPTDLRAVCEEASRAFARSSTSHEVTLSIPDDLSAVTADRKRIGQVLDNLLSNAAKFSPSQEPIEISVDSDQAMVTVRVRDRGRGIPKAKLAHLFKKFSQVHDDAGPGLQGSGLGLAICRGIVEAHGGRIWAESAGEGAGATFVFTLPVATEGAPRPAPAEGAQPPPLRAIVRGDRRRIVVVDEEVQILRYLRRTLEEAGYEPIITSDPTLVPEIVELQEPALVLTDLRMPKMSGFDLIQRLREFSNVPVIFLTASEKSEDVVKALRLGADDYITKPFSPSELLARMEAAQRRRRSMSKEPQVFSLGDLNIDFSERRVTVGGRDVFLSPTEYKLLQELASHAGRVLTHEQLLRGVWGPEYGGETDLLRSFIVLLRRRLGDDARNPRFIFTEPRVGYRMPQPK